MITSKKEIDKFKRKLIIENGEYISYISLSEDKEKITAVVEALFDAEDFEAPDGYYYDVTNKIIYLFEYFEFDCSKRKKGSSRLRENISKANREIKKEIQNIKDDSTNEFVKVIEQGYCDISNNTITYHLGANGDKYRNNYIANFTETFTDHENNIDKYKINCLNKIQENVNQIVIVFVVEDITCMGTYYNQNGKCSEEVNLLLTKQFLELFEKSNVDYLIFKMRDSHESVFSIIDKEFINENIKDKSIDLNQRELFIYPAFPQFNFVKKNST